MNNDFLESLRLGEQYDTHGGELFKLFQISLKDGQPYWICQVASTTLKFLNLGAQVEDNFLMCISFPQIRVSAAFGLAWLKWLQLRLNFERKVKFPSVVLINFGKFHEKQLNFSTKQWLFESQSGSFGHKFR